MNFCLFMMVYNSVTTQETILLGMFGGNGLNGTNTGKIPIQFTRIY